MSPETAIIDSGLSVKVGIFWNGVIFGETRFFYSINVLDEGRCAMAYRAAPRVQRPEGAALTTALGDCLRMVCQR